MCVRLIAPSTLAAWARAFPEASEAVARWKTIVEATDFEHFTALRRVFPHADQVVVA